MSEPLIFDAHLDLSMNALDWNRDLTWPLHKLRESERGKTDQKDRGNGVVTFSEMRRGRIGICVATQIARHVLPGDPRPGWHSPEIAWAHTQGQLAWYKAMERAGQMVQITDRDGLMRMVDLWRQPAQMDDQRPIGYILSLEGADSILSPALLEQAHTQGLRALGPAHYGPGRYARGTGDAGPLGPACKDLLKEMNRLGMILDVTHLTDEGFWQALDLFDGPIWASHSNCRRLVPNDRQFNDDQIRALVQRGAVIGAALDAWMLTPDWIRGVSTPQSTGVTLEHVADQIDHVCQIAGSARHSGIGSDLDGGYGTEQSPGDLDSIADLVKMRQILARRGFSEENVRRVMSDNWIDFLCNAWA